MSLERVERIRRFRVLEIMEYAMKINGTTPEAREAAGTKEQVYVEFAGPICKVRVRVYFDGWYGDAVPGITMEGYLDDDEEMENILTTLLKILAQKEKSS